MKIVEIDEGKVGKWFYEDKEYGDVYIMPGIFKLKTAPIGFANASLTYDNQEIQPIKVTLTLDAMNEDFMVLTIVHRNDPRIVLPDIFKNPAARYFKLSINDTEPIYVRVENVFIAAAYHLRTSKNDSRTRNEARLRQEGFDDAMQFMRNEQLGKN